LCGRTLPQRSQLGARRLVSMKHTRFCSARARTSTRSPDPGPGCGCGVPRLQFAKRAGSGSKRAEPFCGPPMFRKRSPHNLDLFAMRVPETTPFSCSGGVLVWEDNQPVASEPQDSSSRSSSGTSCRLSTVRPRATNVAARQCGSHGTQDTSITGGRSL